MAYILKSTETTTKTGTYTAAFGETVRCDPSGGGFTVTLPTPTADDVGRSLRIKNITSSTNTITVSGGSNTIDGASSVGMSTAHQCLNIEWDGSGFNIMSSYP